MITDAVARRMAVMKSGMLFKDMSLFWAILLLRLKTVIRVHGASMMSYDVIPQLNYCH